MLNQFLSKVIPARKFPMSIPRKKNQRFTALIFLIRIWILIVRNFQIDLSKIGFYIISCTICVNYFLQ